MTTRPPSRPHALIRNLPDTASELQDTSRASRQRSIPSLDGMRAISICLVLCNHLLTFTEIEANRFTSTSLFISLVGNGPLGVNIFFVISGFLITTLLLEEQACTGSINLKNFYIRRVFRILPSYYAFIVILAFLTHAGSLKITALDFMHAATFTWIYNFGNWNWYLAHSWSLSVEEQFYLLWPVAVIALGSRRAIWLAIGLILTAPFARLGFVFIEQGWLHRLCYILAAGRFDVLMSGCLLALLWRDNLFQICFQRFANARLVIPVLLIVVLLSCLGVFPVVAANSVAFTMFQNTFVGLGIAVLLAYTILRPNGAFGRILNSSPLVFVGTLSYSLYVWQQPFLNPHPSNFLQVPPVNLLCAILVALVSFYLIERPMIRLRIWLFKSGRHKAVVVAP